jgi:hypothetical protein
MLIRLIPASPFPTVLFTVSFKNTPPEIPIPTSWNTQIQTLTYDELEVPSLLHALDKSAAMPTLIHEVTFNVPASAVICTFVDGSLEEWPMVDQRCLESLENVARDVENSAASSSEEKKPQETDAQQDNKEEQPHNDGDPVPAPAPSPGKIGKHKRQRSLLMTFVSYVLLLFKLFSSLLIIFPHVSKFIGTSIASPLSESGDSSVGSRARWSTSA